MNAVIENGSVLNIRDLAQEITRRQLAEWFTWMDRILDIHRSQFVFREAGPRELEEHKAALKQAIRTCHLILAQIADPDFNEPELVPRLQVRIRQLHDAYDTFHDAKLSDKQAERILHQVFPE